MQWGGISYMWTGVLIPVVIVLFRYGALARKKATAQFGEEPLVAQLLVLYDPVRSRIKKILCVMAFVCIVLSFLQPKWGFHWEEVKRKGIDIVVALDLSKSMLAEDIQPSRLERAQMEIKNLIALLTGDRIGLVGFAGTAFIQCPLTLDYGTAKIFLDAMDTTMIPEPGTDIGGAIRTAVRAFEGVDKQHRVLILITDGEDHESTVLDAVKEAAKQGIIIYTVGIGSRVGAPIPVTDGHGNVTYVKDRSGQVVLSKMDSELLQKIALMTGGKKGTIGGTSFPLEDIYKNEIGKMEKKELGSSRQKKYENRYQWPLSVALLFLIAELFIPERRRTQGVLPCA